ncbi:PREDICTED: uncharacterized protein LOC109466463 [Branchiostoma belcheri]|uniref:Uncharacterized protein LOC109466463 n=1 Tax=Branchiostoma belcheri TaxID=7741 RepID=A0A6P4YM27_BRABE|nr:PREDICTED: uncharacterized protein LOC109466463 [Branchiostoma belcheri]
MEFITALEKACKFIGPDTEEAAHLRSDCVHLLKHRKMPPSNITKEERLALDDLRKDSSIIILPADKGRATVIMNKSEYQDKCSDLLNDSTTYCRLKKDPTNNYSDKLTKILRPLKDQELITYEQYRTLYPTSTEPPKFYGLPKVHKPDCPLRPIVATRGSIMYQTAKFVANILAPMVGKTQHHLKNSGELVERMSQVTLDDDESLVSFDVSALFTSVPVEESIVIIRDRLTCDSSLNERTKLSPLQVTELLRLCLTTTYFKYEGKFYSQVEGAAMGSPVSPIVANLFMEWFESRALTTFPNPPKVWVRYVDDVGAVLKSSLIEPFHHHLNSIHPNIKFTKELEENRSLPMLDVLMTRKDDGRLKFSVFRKPTHTDQYLLFDSHQPMEHKMGVIRTLRHRADHLITEVDDKNTEYDHLKTVLSIAGYTRWAWQSPGRTKLIPHPRSSTDSRPKGHVTLPYVAGVTEAITRKIRNTGVAVHSTPCTTIRRLLVAPKDKTEPEDTCGVVYHLTCEDCEAQYVGETERALRKRISEHKRESSPVAQHMQTYKHQPGKKVTILDRESRWFERGVKEAVHIRSRSPSLNRDQGRHRLPPIYNSLVQSRDLGDL